MFFNVQHHDASKAPTGAYLVEKNSRVKRAMLYSEYQWSSILQIRISEHTMQYINFLRTNQLQKPSKKSYNTRNISSIAFKLEI